MRALCTLTTRLEVNELSVDMGLQLQQAQLWTKLIPPQPRANPISRTRVLEKLNQALNCKLTVVSAQAGMGKTTAVSEWVASLETGFGWVTLDQTDNDPAVFWVYVISGFSKHINQLEPIIKSLQGAQIPPIRSLLTQFISIFSQQQKSVVLVLDDYHLIVSDEIHQLMDWFVKYLPPSIHVVLLTRELPPLETSQLRLSGQLVDIGNLELQVDQIEAMQFFQECFQINLPESRLTELLALTEGWITGLQLIGLSEPQHLDAISFGKQQRTHRYFLDYFGSQILSQMPSAIRGFVVLTSITDCLNAELCTCLTGQPNAQETLEYLENRNCFTVAIDLNRQWFRYHPLFLEFLREQLIKEVPSSERARLHSIAANWFQKQGDSVRAIEHALSAEDWSFAALLMTAYVPQVYANRASPLTVWLQRLPEQVILEQPALRVARTRIQVENTEELYRNALAATIEEVQIYSRKAQNLTLSAMAFELEGYIAHLMGDLEIALKCYQRALAVVPKDELILRSVFLTGQGMCCTNARLYDKAIAVFKKAQDLCQKIGLVETDQLIESALAIIFHFKGDLYQAEKTAQRMIVFQKTSNSWAEANAYLLHGLILHEWNMLDQALNESNLALEIAKSGWEEPFWHNFYLGLGKILVSQGKKSQGLYHLFQALESVNKMGNQIEVRKIEAIIARSYINSKDFSQTDDWFQKTSTIALEKLYFEEIVTLVKFFNHQKKYAKAQKIVQHAFSRYHESSDLLQLHILSASIANSRGHTHKALFHLEQIMPIAKNGGYLRIFLDEGSGMNELLKNIPIKPQYQTYVRGILQAFEYESVALDPPNQLSIRESEIFKMLEQGNTNKDIARQLDLAIPTIKMHVSNIYKKLGVKNRLQAVEKPQAQQR
jgi:LuxR family transcriptional regulator, maltose regulon positive regulatory protein